MGDAVDVADVSGFIRALEGLTGANDRKRALHDLIGGIPKPRGSVYKANEDQSTSVGERVITIVRAVRECGFQIIQEKYFAG